MKSLMKSPLKLSPRKRGLLAALCLIACDGSAQATVFAGKMYGPTSPDAENPGLLVPWAEIGFRYDSATMPFFLDPTSTAAHASYYFDSTAQPGTTSPMYITGPGIGTKEQGMFNHLDLYNDAGGQRIVFTSGSVHFGGIGATIVGPSGAFFSNARDLSTLHTGLVYAAASSGFFSTQYSNFHIYNPSVVFAAAVPEPETWLLLGAGGLACLWVMRRRQRAFCVPAAQAV